MRVPKPAKRSPRPRKRLPKVRRSTVAALKRKLWTLVARYVKDRDINICVTCGGSADQAGHFYSRSIASLVFDPKNIGAQCATCNLYLHGNPGAFADYIVSNYGSGELVRLTARAQVHKRWRPDELKTLIEAIKRDPAEFESAYYEGNL